MGNQKGIRTCVVCRRKRQKEDLLRLISDPSGKIIADIDGVLDGRGAYVCEACLDGLKKIKPIRWKSIFHREDVYFTWEGLSAFDCKSKS